MSAIIIKELTKKFGEFTAVDSVSFSVETGELFGLLGPNGAGKTTILNMLTTFLLPTADDAEIAGYDLRRDPYEIRNNIGIIFQDPSLDIGLTGRENLEFHAMMYNSSPDKRKERIREMLDVIISDYEKNTPDIFQTAGSLGIGISSINFSKPSLEDVFIRLTGSTIREQEGSRKAVRRDRMRRRMLRGFREELSIFSGGVR
ncbi:ABC transporter, ATP-binding protein [Methanosarcina horonobensis HB-1 = JCM 15518]|uniref:ABC transporter, ATP-binding protein n=1 Tax=Methanosarcina horonobensis HB-1 = JCM 15518 TaxID=1434110 RepID=A0A0E3SG01_9EURY|nr:ATP-binding cassette domain-containing protein [Methanosarcina horonobensis]AKB79202.1 ABC transporter, ATP-binding protein [Methanosarcina horonobensis HB-1 = JCM 15518]